MQDQGDRPARPGRPSLISSEKPPEPGQRGILSALDGKPATASSQGADPTAAACEPKPVALLLGGFGVGLIAVIAAYLALSGGESADLPPPVAVAAAPAAPAPAVPPALPAVAAAPKAEAAIPPATAAVLKDAPEVAAASPAPAEAAPFNSIVNTADNNQPEKNPLSDALERPVKQRPQNAERKPEENALSDALERPVKQRPQKAERKPEEKRIAARKEKPPVKAAQKPQDNDVVLLAALMSHIQPRSRKATPAEQLNICKQYNAAGEEQCRARLCEGDARKEPECKARRALQGASDT